jgi:Carbohydrate esterase, sialic acid-specific acetylesterase
MKRLVLFLGVVVLLSVAATAFYYGRSTQSTPPQTAKPEAKPTVKSDKASIKGKKAAKLITLPSYRQIYQQINGQAEVRFEIANNVDCQLDSLKFSNQRYKYLSVGKHTLLCQSAKEYEEVPFYVGDVFIVSGQSNGLGWAVDPEKTPLPKGNTIWHDPIERYYRSLGVDIVKSQEKGQLRGSAWVSFANEYTSTKNMPVGFIDLIRITPIDSYIAGLETPRTDFFYPIIINEIQKFGKISGFIWYHGESAIVDEEHAKSYEKKLSGLIENIRIDTGYHDLPFYLVNLARWHPEDENEHTQNNWEIVREGIKNTAEKLDNVYVVASADDLPLNCEAVETSKDCMHLSQEGLNELGLRLARNIIEIQATKDVK